MCSSDLLSYDRERFERRRARLGTNWYQVTLGAKTKNDTRLLVERARSASSGIQSSLLNGAVLGGGLAFAELAVQLEALSASDHGKAVARSLAYALRATRQQLQTNFGVSGSVANRFDVVQDPYDLTKAILNQSVSFASTLARAGAVITR